MTEDGLLDVSGIGADDGGGQVGDLVVEGEDIGLDIIGEFSGMVLITDGEFPALVAFGRAVDGLAFTFTFDAGVGGNDEDVLRLSGEVVEGAVDAILEKAEVDPFVELAGGFPFEVGVGGLCQDIAAGQVACACTIDIVGGAVVAVGGGILVKTGLPDGAIVCAVECETRDITDLLVAGYAPTAA